MAEWCHFLWPMMSFFGTNDVIFWYQWSNLFGTKWCHFWHQWCHFWPLMVYFFVTNDVIRWHKWCIFLAFYAIIECSPGILFKLETIFQLFASSFSRMLKIEKKITIAIQLPLFKNSIILLPLPSKCYTTFPPQKCDIIPLPENAILLPLPKIAILLPLP